MTFLGGLIGCGGVCDGFFGLVGLEITEVARGFRVGGVIAHSRDGVPVILGEE